MPVTRTLAVAAFCFSVALLPRSGIAAELRVSGAATVSRAIVIPNQAAIEAETGLTLAVTTNGDGNGLKDLYAGRSDVAMVAAPLKVTEETVNRVTPNSVSIADFQLVPLGAVSIHFVVNGANPVKTLSEPQLRDIFTGKTTSWKDVGGADEPIVVVAEVAGLGTRSNVVSNFLGGAEITPNARTMQALVQVVQVVGQLPNAISYGNSASITGNVAVIPGVEVRQPLGLVTKGEPSADARKFIAAVGKYSGAIK